MTPTDAYYKALKEGPSDLTRNIACQEPYWAYLYALDVDKKPSKQTRDAACQGPEYAYCYAIDVDKQPSKQTRNAACQNATYAYWYDEFGPVVKQEAKQEVAQDSSRYPHICPHCGSAAYIPLMGTPECSKNCNA